MDNEELKTLEQLQADVVKGERVRVLYELLQEECGLTYEMTLREIMTGVQTAMKNYYKALETLQGRVQQTGKKLTRKTGGVS